MNLLSFHAQRIRLEEITDGRRQPEFEREHLFLQTLRRRGAVNLRDFILPGMLFLAERLRERSGEAPPAPTAS